MKDSGKKKEKDRESEKEEETEEEKRDMQDRGRERADAKRTPSYSSNLLFIGIIMQLSDL